MTPEVKNILDKAGLIEVPLNADLIKAAADSFRRATAIVDGTSGKKTIVVSETRGIIGRQG